MFKSCLWLYKYFRLSSYQINNEHQVYVDPIYIIEIQTLKCWLTKPRIWNLSDNRVWVHGTFDNNFKM